MIQNMRVMQTLWTNRLEAIKLCNDEWKENFYIFSKDIKEEVLSKRVLLLRYRLIEAETKQLVYDYYMD
jgi:hypothetical protein